VALGDAAQGLVVGTLTEDVDGDDPPGTVGDEVVDEVGVDGGGVGAHVGEDRVRPHVAHRVAGGRIGVVGDDDLVAGTDVESDHRQVERCRAVGHRDHVLSPRELCEAFLEFPAPRALAGHPAGLEDGAQGLDLLFAKRGLSKSDHSCSLDCRQDRPVAEKVFPFDDDTRARSSPRRWNSDWWFTSIASRW
jgi:hypothetical protein